MERLQTMRDNKYITKIVAACLLGDGCVSRDGETTPGQNSRFQLSMTEKNRDHIEYIQERIEPISRTNIRLHTREVENAKDGLSRQDQLRLVGGRHPFYTNFRNRMYPHGYKVVDPHYLTLVDWEFLAILFQQDGTLVHSYANKKYLNYAVSIATLNFSYGDNMLMKKAFKEKLGLEWNVSPTTKNGKRMWFLRLMNKQLFQFIDGVMPYIQPSFMYKTDLSHGLPLWATKGDDIVGSA